MAKCALPPHLAEKRHSDWIWPMSLIPRAWNAFGPRCGEGNEGYKPWPPLFVKGHGVSRWENDGASSIVYIPMFDHLTISGADIYGRKFRAIEMAKGNKFYDTEIEVYLRYEEGMNTGLYSPSALQKFSDSGWMVLEPHYYACWKVLKRIPDGEDIVAFHRRGFRPDHCDIYYNRSVAYFGLHWE